MIKVSVISYVNPFSDKKTGGNIDIEKIIRATNMMGAEIDLYTVLKEDEKIIQPLGKELVNRITYDTVYQKKINLLSRYPFAVKNRYPKKVIQSILKEKKIYDLALYEGEHITLFKLNNVIKSKVNYLRMVNIESNYSFQTFKSVFPNIFSMLHLLEAIKFRFLERKIIKHFDRFLFISKEEKEIYEKKYPELKDKFILMPPVIECRDKINYDEAEECNILYFGDLKIYHNILGVKWFIDNSLPHIRSQFPNVKVNIIGDIECKSKKILEADNVKVLGYVDDLDNHIRKSTMIITPILYGAGVKIKVLYALSQGKIVVGTTKSVEGTDFQDNKHLLISDDSDEFAKYCNNILMNTEKYKYLPENAIEHLKSHYSIESQSDLLIN